MSDSKHTIYGSRVEREIEHLRKMQSYYAFFLTDFTGFHTVAGNTHRVYLALDVDARIAELEKALHEVPRDSDSGEAMSAEQLPADAPLIIWTTGSQYIRKDEYDRLTRERDQYKLAAEMAQTSIIELQKERDALAERLSVAEELFASECEDPVNNPDAYLWYHGERHKKLAEDADNMTNPIFNGA